MDSDGSDFLIWQRNFNTDAAIGGVTVASGDVNGDAGKPGQHVSSSGGGGTDASPIVGHTTISNPSWTALYDL